VHAKAMAPAKLENSWKRIDRSGARKDTQRIVDFFA